MQMIIKLFQQICLHLYGTRRRVALVLVRYLIIMCCKPLQLILMLRQGKLLLKFCVFKYALNHSACHTPRSISDTLIVSKPWSSQTNCITSLLLDDWLLDKTGFVIVYRQLCSNRFVQSEKELTYFPDEYSLILNLKID